MEGLIKQIKKHLVSNIKNIRITKFNNLIIIVDDSAPLTVKINEIYTSMTSSGVCIFTLNEDISFDKRFEIKCNSNMVWGSVTYTIE